MLKKNLLFILIIITIKPPPASFPYKGGHGLIADVTII
jgi:hypothetical protein